MDFSTLEIIEDDKTYTPFAAQDSEGNWLEGAMSIDFLNTHFGGLTKEEIFTKAQASEGLTLYFKWLDEQGKLN